MSFLHTILAPARPRIVVWTREPLAEAELASALASWDETSPQRLAVVQLIQQQLDEVTAALSNPELTPEKLRHGAGALDALQSLQARLEEYLG